MAVRLSVQGLNGGMKDECDDGRVADCPVKREGREESVQQL